MQIGALSPFPVKVSNNFPILANPIAYVEVGPTGLCVAFYSTSPPGPLTWCIGDNSQGALGLGESKHSSGQPLDMAFDVGKRRHTSREPARLNSTFTSKILPFCNWIIWKPR